jgi:two-component system, cell cycle sensor histidine kinase and response regulator CckA
MPEGGTIRVAGKNVARGAKRKDRHIPLPAGEYVKILIKDEGPGIPEDLLHKIFDPFFSTKEKGSGLGLATAYSIIANHAGFIQAESQIGKGAIFTIYLPASTRASLPDIIEDDLVYGTGRILVVDDEAGIREVVGGMLAKLGYEVQFAEDGAEAIGLYQQAKKTRQPFDLLVMDLTIPGGMGGKEAIKKLRREDPYVKAVVSSGYSDEPVMANYARYGFQGAIKKPYTINEVSRVVHAVIKRR